MFVDSHCHIAGSEFEPDLQAVVDRARAQGVAQALVILAADDQPELEQRRVRRGVLGGGALLDRRASAQCRHVRRTIPTAVIAVVDAAIERQPRTRALGEIGLDYHYDFAPRRRAAAGVCRADPPGPDARPANRARTRARPRRIPSGF